MSVAGWTITGVVFLLAVFVASMILEDTNEWMGR